MPGISNVLNIAKEALLAHQMAVQVTSHNVANANTPGFTRQTLELKANIATPTAFGNIGSGVVGEGILRKYDQFMTQRLMKQSTNMGNLEAQQQSYRVVESIFNEASGLGLNDLMSQFWNSWQNLANSPDTLSFRQEVVQQAQLLNQQLHSMNNEIANIKYDINLNLDSAIRDVNSLTAEIASLNSQITGSETAQQQANDLRDKRDELVRELSGYLDVSYFENSIGEYSVVLADGHALVNSTTSWDINWTNGQLTWVSQSPTTGNLDVEIGKNVSPGGKIGGMLEVYNQLTEENPDNYLGRLNALANAFIREVNQQHSQGVGLTTFAEDLNGTEVATNTARLTTTIDTTTALDTIGAGTLVINDREVGKIKGAMAVNGLAMAKAANAATAVNAAGAGVIARLTTLVAGTAVTPMAASPANNGDTLSFSINGITVDYTIDNDGLGGDDSDPAVLAANLVGAINAAIAVYNTDPTTPVTMSIEAVVGDGTNGGVLNSLVIRNTNDGDQSRIIISDLSSTPAGLEGRLGLTAGEYVADSTHNTGELTLFSDEIFTVQAGADDTYLDHLGMGGGLHASDTDNDGRFTYQYSNPGGVANALMGFQYGQDLQTDDGSFDIWLYKSNGTLALPQPVTVSLERAFTLADVARAINVSISNATGGPQAVNATVQENKLLLTPAEGYAFAFANDTSHFLQVAGLNTFFSGYSAGTIEVNAGLAANLSRLTAGTVSDSGEILRGDNTNALLITTIQKDENIEFADGSIGNLDDYYNSLVGEIGITGRRIARDLESNTLVLNQINELRASASGVSLDEEMANLIKFQHAYTAAAKLLTSADEMMSTLIQSLNR